MSKLLDNRAAVGGGAIYCYDGALTITNSRLAGNRADTGGAIYNDGCVVTIQNTTFQDNQATGCARDAAGLSRTH
jgi:predicted outer membrane repeat protein